MSPRHFAKMLETKEYRDSIDQAILDQIQPGMNLWYAFFTVTGLDKSITNLFSYTPKDITNYPVKDPQSGI